MLKTAEKSVLTSLLGARSTRKLVEIHNTLARFYFHSHSKFFFKFSAHPWVKAEDKIPYEWQPILTPLEEIRKSVFRKLWLRGFYITSGEKFGGDFLVYPGYKNVCLSLVQTSANRRPHSRFDLETIFKPLIPKSS